MKRLDSGFYTMVRREQNWCSVTVVSIEAILLYLDQKFLLTPYGLQTKEHACDPCFQS
jgi:hypothetical protein